MKLRDDGGRPDDPPPEHECRAGCGRLVTRKHDLCRRCFTLRDKDRGQFRGELKERGLG